MDEQRQRSVRMSFLEKQLDLLFAVLTEAIARAVSEGNYEKTQQIKELQLFIFGSTEQE